MLEQLHAETWEHLHSIQFVRPTLAAPITVTSNVAAYTLGAFSNDIIAAGDITVDFDLHWVVINNETANAWYELVLYYGAADTEFARVVFARANATTRSDSLPIISGAGTSGHEKIPANSRVRAKVADSAGGSAVDIKVMGHRY